jgi:hypothetical protein
MRENLVDALMRVAPETFAAASMTWKLRPLLKLLRRATQYAVAAVPRQKLSGNAWEREFQVRAYIRRAVKVRDRYGYKMRPQRVTTKAK